MYQMETAIGNNGGLTVMHGFHFIHIVGGFELVLKGLTLERYIVLLYMV